MVKDTVEPAITLLELHNLLTRFEKTLAQISQGCERQVEETVAFEAWSTHSTRRFNVTNLLLYDKALYLVRHISATIGLCLFLVHATLTYPLKVLHVQKRYIREMLPQTPLLRCAATSRCEYSCSQIGCLVQPERQEMRSLCTYLLWLTIEDVVPLSSDNGGAKNASASYPWIAEALTSVLDFLWFTSYR